MKVETVVWSNSQFTRTSETPPADPAPAPKKNGRRADATPDPATLIPTSASPAVAAGSVALGNAVAPAAAAAPVVPAAPISAKAGKEALVDTIGHDTGEPFTESAPPGMILVGFEFTTGKVNGNRIVKSARAVYRGPVGEVVGKQFGNPAGEVTRVIARPGYGVDAIEGGCGLHHISRLTLHFARVNGNSIVPAESYDAPAFGPRGNGSSTITAKKPVVGIHGAAGANIDAIGLTAAN